MPKKKVLLNIIRNVILIALSFFLVLLIQIEN
jgi:hypothetical protein